MGEIAADGSVEIAKSNLQKNSEVNITVNWSGGGQLKEGGDQWTIDTLTEVAVRFPDLVASCPQRTHAILTKYTALRGYLEWKAAKNVNPLDYELAQLYTADLLDIYMGYKVIWDGIHTMLESLDNKTAKYTKAPDPATPIKAPRVPTNADKTAWADGETLTPFEPSYSGLDTAIQKCRLLMVRLVTEVEDITVKPSLAVDPNRPVAYLRPQTFKQLLPIVTAPPKGVAGITGAKNIRFGALDAFATPATTQNTNSFGYAAGYVQPSIMLGIQKMDLGYPNSRVRTKIYASDIKLNASTLNMSIVPEPGDNVISPSQSRTFVQQVNALAIPANDDLIQAGEYFLPWRSTASNQTFYQDYRYRIDFTNKYKVPPKVVVWLHGFDKYSNDTQDMGIIAESIDISGFTLRTRLQSGDLYSFSASWLAFPADKIGIAAGNSGMVNALKGGQTVSVQGHVTFDQGVFSAPPRVFVAMSGWAYATKDWLRVEYTEGEVDQNGFNWYAKSWNNASQLIDATVGWVALAN